MLVGSFKQGLKAMTIILLVTAVVLSLLQVQPSTAEARDTAEIRGVSAGSGHSLAYRTDGSVAAWGYNGYGQLGEGLRTDS